jgi:hypothetical protein
VSQNSILLILCIHVGKIPIARIRDTVGEGRSRTKKVIIPGQVDPVSKTAQASS